MAQKPKNAAWADCCEDWGDYMTAKKAKLEEQFQEAAKFEFSDASTLFNGIAIFVNGYTNPTADELKRLMMAHGGVYHHYLRSKSTTHMIASNLPYSKIVAYKKAQNPLPLCKPEWITESITAGKLLDYRKYLLYTNNTKNQANFFSKPTNQETSQLLVQTKQTNSNSTISVAACDEMTNEKKNQLRLQITSNPEVSSVISNCTKNPEFLTEFYNNSRLHHIATMGAMFKDYINDLRDKSDGKFPDLEALIIQSKVKHSKAGPSKRLNDSDSDDDLFNKDECISLVNPIASTSGQKNSIIMHIDMDCFFVSVGLRDHPELKGFPVAVAHAKGNKQSLSNDANEYGSMSEVASCSYEARKVGVKNGMLLGQALKLCPNLKIIKYNFEGYKEVSYSLYDTVSSYTLDIEAVSCDEMYANCTKILELTNLTPLEFASIIRNEIKEKTGCPVSTGFGGNKLQARLATKKAKPDGQYFLTGNEVKSFIRTLNVKDLPGVGYSTNQKLQQMNVQTCADLEVISLHELQKEFGKKNGQQLYDMCRGIDQTKLNLEHIRKSISAEVNYGIRFEDTVEAHEFLKKLSLEISDRLKNINSKGRCITLKVMFRAKEAPHEPMKFMGHGLCDAFNKSKNLIAATDDPVIIARETISLWNQLNQKPEDARGIGIQMTKLESTRKKTNGATLLSFIDKMKASEQNFNEPCYSINANTLEFQNKAELNLKTPSTNKDYKSQEANEITLSLEEQLLSENVNFDKADLNECQEVVEINNKLNNNNFREVNNDVNKLPPTEVETKSSSQLKQTKQSDYFKKTKPSFNKSGKIKVPDIKEIDMKVLIELPDDIRNEILNEYKENKSIENGETSANPETSEKNVDNKTISNINNKLERDFSFSQIDPEFLAALPDDMKNEVKSYCDAQKRRHTEQVEEKRNVNSTTKGWNMFKNDKKPQRNTKLKTNKLKLTKNGAKKETKNNASNNKIVKDAEIDSNKLKVQKINKIIPTQINEAAAPRNRSFHFDPSNGDAKHSEILSSLVNCLLDLPISQVKVQIQEWIVNNSDVNDVDFLSLTTYLGTLPRKRRIEDLHILLKCLHRCISKSGSCIWHETYRKMLKHIQTRMRLEYGNNLMIPEKVECDKCS